MPELPELEVFCRNLRQHLHGQSITAATLHREKRANVTDAQLQHAMVGAVVNGVERAGKEVHFRLSNRRTLGVHLMLKGAFQIVDDPDAVKYRVLTLQTGAGRFLIVSDPNGLATVTVDPHTDAEAPDALSAAFSAEYLSQQLRKAGGTLAKAFLVDQRNVLGIGNAYSDEILWRSRISPESRCDRIPAEAVRTLHAAVSAVLTDAIGQIARLRPDALGGDERSFLQIHNPDRTTCPNGRPLLVKEVARKRTFYTDEQVLYP